MVPFSSSSSHAARSRVIEVSLASDRAHAGMPSRLPIEPGEAEMIASCSSRVRPSHQALTSSGVPSCGSRDSGSSAGSATPPYFFSTCSTVATRMNAETIRCSEPVTRFCQAVTAAASSSQPVWQESASAWIAGASSSVASRARSHSPAIHCIALPRRVSRSVRSSSSCAISSAWSSACWWTLRSASDIASARAPSGPIVWWYVVESSPCQSPIRASPVTNPPRSSIWAEAERRSWAKARIATGSTSSCGVSGGSAGITMRVIAAPAGVALSAKLSCTVSSVCR